MATPKTKSDILKSRAKPSSSRLFLYLFKWLFWSGTVCLAVGAAAVVFVFLHLSEDLPKITSLSDYHPAIITTVYSDDNRKIAEFCKERRIVIPLSEMPKMMTEAFISAEDSRFYTHKGIDLQSILRAFFKNIEAGAIVQGGSTITQQVTKSLLLTPEKSYQRKIKEAILAYRIDRTLTKEDILYLYLNQIYLGHAAYGVEAASENYFGKSAKDLNLAECAMLAGLPQAPSRYSPFKHPDLAKQRQVYVLNRMVAEGYITNLQATEAINTDLDIKERRNWYIEEVPDYTEYVRQYVEKKYGETALYTEGLQIYTAVNIEMQKTAHTQIEKGLRALDKRQGYRGPLRHLATAEIAAHIADLKEMSGQSDLEPGSILAGVVTAVDSEKKSVSVQMGSAQGVIPLAEMRWARTPDPEVFQFESQVTDPGRVLSVGDVVQVKLISRETGDTLWRLGLEQTPAVQGALLCIEAETGMVKTMMGGKDFLESKFNRALQSRRQPGSAFKPIVFLAALENGYTPASVVIDSPVVFTDADTSFKWKPKNYEEKFHGPTLLRDALAESRNIISIKLLQDIGVEKAIAYAQTLGITSPLSHDLSLALGSSGVSLFELVTAYSVFANQGELVTPIFITKICDRTGKVLEQHDTEKKQVIDKPAAYIMTSMLESVVKSGTGQRVQALNRPVAGKTGTTNNLNDAWFIGYTPDYITGTWVGFDEEQSLGKGETGSRAASPIWLGFMQEVSADKPVRAFAVPEGVVFSRIDTETGLLPIAESKKTRFEVFKEGTAPTEYTTPAAEAVEADEFFKSDM